MAKIKITFIFGAAWLSVIFVLVNQVKAAQDYDLKADSLIMNSVKCEVNQNCSFTAKVKNLGADFTLDFPLKSAVSADGLANPRIAASPAQNTVIKTSDYLTFAINNTFTKMGAVTLNFSIDPAGYLTESNSSNNSVSLSVKVLGYDLAAESITVTPAYPIINKSSYILVAVKNNSTYNLFTNAGLGLSKTFPDFVVADASSTEPTLSKMVNSGAYLYYGYEGKFTTLGERQLSFTVDPDDALKETNLTNNAVSKKITVYNDVDTDLTLNSISLSAGKAVLNAPLDITIGIKNTGQTSLVSDNGLAKPDLGFSLPNFQYSVTDFTFDQAPSLADPFNPGEVFNYKFRGYFSQPGKISLTFSVNQNNRLIEYNLTNNATTTPLTVYQDQASADDFSFLSQSVSLISSTTALFSWATDVKATGVLSYDQVGYNVNNHKVEAGGSALRQALTLNNLRPGIAYGYAITAKSGTAEKTGATANFTMPENDVLKATFGPRLSLSGKNATFSWTTNLISSSQVYYKNRSAAALSRAGSDSLTAEHQVEIKDLAIGVYDYFLSSTSTPGSNFKTDWAGFEIVSASTTPSAPSMSTSTAGAIKTGPVAAAFVSYPVTNGSLSEKLKGKIILRVESQGQAYYFSPKDKKLYFLGKPEDAFRVIRSQAVGLTNGNLMKIPVGFSALSGLDSDQDGLPDAFEDALGTAKNKADTDGDGHGDKTELAGGYSPLAKTGKIKYDQVLANKQKGKILLQVEGRGQAWYVNPADGKRYFLANPADAFNIMRKLGVGVTNANYQALGGK